MDNNPNTPLLNNIVIESDNISNNSNNSHNNISSSSLNDNISTDSIKECWICKDIVDTHIKFCECNGYISFVHRECLNTWINTSRKTTCDFCDKNYKFNSEYDKNIYLSRIMPNFLIVLLIIVGCILTFIKGSPLYINSVIIWVGAICLIFIVISDFNKFKEAILNESIRIVLMPYD